VQPINTTKLSRIPALLCSQWTCIVILLAAAAAQMLHRSPPVQRGAFFCDFSNVYSASRAWLHGDNPYSIHQVYRAWQTSNHGPYLGSADEGGLRMWAAVHPPSTLLLISPLAALNAPAAHLLWIGIGITLLTATFFALFSLGGIHDTRSRMLLVACALASAPVECAIESGQPALPAAALVILAVWAFSKERIILAGLLLGLATALKLQVGGSFIVYYLFIRQWRVGTLAAAIFGFITLAAIARMHAFGIDHWWMDWHRNVAATLDPGQVNDPRPGGPWRNDMVNLQTLLDVALHPQFQINACVLMIFMPMLAGFLTRLRPGRAAGMDLLALSVVALLAMLPLYRRLYDNVLLLMLLTWAISNLQTRHRAFAIGVLAMLGEFLIPIDLVPFVLRRTHVFDSMVSSLWWQGLVVPHHAWGALIVAVGTWSIFYRRTMPVAAVVRPFIPANAGRLASLP
jgi:hypothetical protein